MYRVFDFQPAEQEVVVSRVLVLVHQAVDDTFPHAKPASARFAKTAFIGFDEPTLTQLLPSDATREAAPTGNTDETGDTPLNVQPRSHTPRSKPGIESISDEQPISQEDELTKGLSWWKRRDNAALMQTIIGVVTLGAFIWLVYFLFL